MKGFFSGGLALVVGGLVGVANAQDFQWRPAGTSTDLVRPQTEKSVAEFRPLKQTIRLQNEEQFASFPRKITLLRPVPLRATPTKNGDSGLLRVSFRPAEGQVEEPQINDDPGADILQPLPAAPLEKRLKVIPAPQTLPPPSVTVLPDKIIPHPTPEPKLMYDYLPGGEVVCLGEEGSDCGFCSECGFVRNSGRSCRCWKRKSAFGKYWDSCCANQFNCQIPRFYANAEFLIWAMDDANLPPLATMSLLSVEQAEALNNIALMRDPNGFPIGAIGQPGTVVIFNEDEIDSPTFAGGRFTVGYKKIFRNMGIEGTFLFLGENRSQFFASSDGTGSPFLVVPYFDSERMREDGIIAASPGMFDGFIRAELSTQLWGVELYIRKPWRCGCNYKLDFLAGFRFLELSDGFELERNTTALRNLDDMQGNVIVEGTNTRNVDMIGTRNQFYGGQIGADFEYHLGRWVLGATGKIALGNVYQEVNLNGFRVTTLGNEIDVGDSTFLVQSSNMGRHERDHFAVVPEVSLKVGYQITCHLTAYVSYNFLYISNVVRPGEQIDRSFVPCGRAPSGSFQPMFVFRDIDHWAQGVNFGLNWRY